MGLCVIAFGWPTTRDFRNSKRLVLSMIRRVFRCRESLHLTRSHGTPAGKDYATWGAILVMDDRVDFLEVGRHWLCVLYEKFYHFARYYRDGMFHGASTEISAVIIHVYGLVKTVACSATH